MVSVDAIVGRRKDTGKRAKVIVKPIPGSIPNQAFWCTFEKSGAAAFDYPKFSPPPIDINNAAGIPHLGLEKLLNFLIGGPVQMSGNRKNESDITPPGLFMVIEESDPLEQHPSEPKSSAAFGAVIETDDETLITPATKAPKSLETTIEELS